VIVGSVSKEYRMIGWRIGWVTAPVSILQDIAKVHIYNVVTPPGIAQSGAIAALQSSSESLSACISEWQQRRDAILQQLHDFPITPAAGGWSMLMNVKKFGYDSLQASRLLLERGKVAATPMKNWGEKNGDDFIRFVFSNEPVERLNTLRDRVHRAFA
jgi:aspartate/methionine/tyrosine aminotransferase